jgi:amidohydrolase
MDLAELKQQMVARVDALAPVLVDVSHRIHERPELLFEEHFAHDLLSGILEQEGVDTVRGAYGLDTAFAARAGREGPVIAVCCEYDALPGIGHACGHNIIAAAGLGAGLAAAALADTAGGRVVILGTPAEEGGAGKVLMADEGAFDGVDAAMMVHPAGADLCTMDAIASAFLRVDYRGEAAHAAAFPQRGRNALDAAVLGYVNVAALRQHIRPTDRIHGVFTKAGDKPNIVPDHTAMEWMVRSARAATLDRLKPRVVAALEAGAHATGCTVEHRFTGRDYADLVDLESYMGLYRDNMATLGRQVLDPRSAGMPVVGSTDMGNISYLVPSIHPMIQVAPPHVSIHSAEFTRYAGSPDGDRAVVDGAKAMAMTIADLWATPTTLGAVRDEFTMRVPEAPRP